MFCKHTANVHTDRHHCFKSGNIPITEGGQILLIFVEVLWSPLNSADTKKRLCWSENTGNLSTLTPTTFLTHVVVTVLSPIPQYLRNVRTISGRQELYILKTHMELPYLVYVCCSYRSRKSRHLWMVLRCSRTGMLEVDELITWWVVIVVHLESWTQ